MAREVAFRDLSLYFHDILHTAREALVVVDTNLQIIHANDAFYQFMDTSDLNKNIPPDPANSLWMNQKLQAKLRESFSDKKNPERFEIEIAAPGGETFDLMIHIHQLYSTGNRSPLILLALSDISEIGWIREKLQKELEACSWTRDELQDSDNRFRMLVETMNDGLALRDENGVMTYVNSKLCEILGYTRDEILGRQATDFLDEKNKRTYIEQMTLREAGSTESYELETARKNGQKLELLLSPKPIFDINGNIKGSFAIVSDITERKRIETALRDSEKKLRILSEHLLTAHEREREHIARELHDELGQNLAVLKYQMRFIEKRLRKDQQSLREACQDMLQQIDGMVDNVRLISHNLGLHNLQQLGLTASLHRIFEDFRKHSNIAVSVNTVNIDNYLSQKAETNLYRIFQEALTNISKHARATSVFISVEKKDNDILCSLRDNGIGFDIDATLSRTDRTGGMGLTTMQERAQMIGGSMTITSQKGAGTHISITIPISEEESSGQFSYRFGGRSPAYQTRD